MTHRQSNLEDCWWSTWWSEARAVPWWKWKHGACMASAFKQQRIQCQVSIKPFLTETWSRFRGKIRPWAKWSLWENDQRNLGNQHHEDQHKQPKNVISQSNKLDNLAHDWANLKTLTWTHGWLRFENWHETNSRNQTGSQSKRIHIEKIRSRLDGSDDWVWRIRCKLTKEKQQKRPQFWSNTPRPMAVWAVFAHSSPIGGDKIKRLDKKPTKKGIWREGILKPIATFG